MIGTKWNPWSRIKDLECSLEVRDCRIATQKSQLDTRNTEIRQQDFEIGRLKSQVRDEELKVKRMERAANAIEHVLQASRTEIRDEGCPCPCGGTFEYGPVEGCTCHCGHPPCGACVNNPLRCPKCYWTSG